MAELCVVLSATDRTFLDSPLQTYKQEMYIKHVALIMIANAIGACINMLPF